MNKRISLGFTGDKNRMMSLKIQDFILKRRMNKMDKWKPGIIASMRESVENKCQMEYNDEIERLNDEIQELKHINSELSRGSNKYKAKFEEYKELYEKLLDKHEKKSEILGETKEKLNTAEADLKEIINDNISLGENTDFQKELKSLVTKCNNERYNKSEIISKFSAKWNVSLKEVLEDDKLIDFKYKEVNNE